MYNGYTMIIGAEEARQAIVDKYSQSERPFAAKDVVLSFGCSGALYNVFSALCEIGDNILVPRPGWPGRYAIVQNIGVNLKFYDLNPEKSWQADLDGMRAQIDGKTRAILVNNPSNPCGACLPRDHLLEIIDIAH
jgi:tyrosine aminotransferase